MITRNHTNHRVGQCHQRAKLSSVQVAKIRRMYKPRIVSYAALAAEFDCGISTIRDIVQYRTRASG